MRAAPFALAVVLPLMSVAAELPAPVLPAGVGVNIHFVTGHERDLDLIAAGGFKFVRMDFGWAGIERTKGEYDWSGYEELLGNLEKRGLRPVFILDYSNPLYESTVTNRNPITGEMHRSTASPQHPDSVAAYARGAAAAARRFQGRHVIWEIWNEPNIDFWSPKPDVRQYTTLALAACKAIKEAEPGATVVGPASSGFPWEFLESFLGSGVLQYLDAVSVHPYREYRHGPETAAADYERLKAIIDRHAPASKKGQISILSGEWGYATHAKGVSLETQAAFAARQQLANLLHGVPLSIWYDWKNDGPDKNEREHNFGTVTSDLSPKPSYQAIKTLAHELSGFRITRRVPLESDKDYVLLLANEAGERKLAAWSTTDPHEVRVALDTGKARELSGTEGNGKPLTAVVESGKLVLVLSPLPQYLSVASPQGR